MEHVIQHVVGQLCLVWRESGDESDAVAILKGQVLARGFELRLHTAGQGREDRVAQRELCRICC